MSAWPAFLSDFLNIESKQNEQSSVQLLLSPIFSESSPDIICVFVLQRLFGFYFTAIQPSMTKISDFVPCESKVIN